MSRIFDANFIKNTRLEWDKRNMYSKTAFLHPNAYHPAIIPKKCLKYMKKWEREVQRAGSVDRNHRQNMKEAEQAFRKFFDDTLYVKEEDSHFLFTTGSFGAGLDINSSDMDFTVFMKTWTKETVIESYSEDETFSNQKKRSDVTPWKVDEKSLRRIRKKMLACIDRSKRCAKWNYKDIKYFEYGYSIEEIVHGNVPVLQMQDVVRGVHIDLTFQTANSIQHSQLLSFLGKLNPVFPQLCRAVKRWGKETGLICSVEGRLNSLSVCYMVTHFLQAGVEPAVLPPLEEVVSLLAKPRRKDGTFVDDINLAPLLKPQWKSKNKMRLGVLFYKFLEYFSDFDFVSYAICVKKGTAKLRPEDKDYNSEAHHANFVHHIVVEDPFKEKLSNCASTVYDDVDFENIMKQFSNTLQDMRNKGTITNTWNAEWGCMWEQEIFMSPAAERTAAKREGKRRNKNKDWETPQIDTNCWYD